jgi:SsrA-binding protein
LKVYFNSRGFVKVELGLGKGKRLYDKREDIKRRENDLALRRMVKNRKK